RYQPVSQVFKTTAMVGAVVMLLFGVVQFVDFLRAYNLPRKQIRLFSKTVIVDLDSKAMPETIETQVDEDTTFRWQLLGYSRMDRPHGSDFGERSDRWRYRSLNSGMLVHSSLDQTFPGWHELTTCYRNMGYELASLRQKKTESFVNEDGETLDWTYVEVELIDPALSKRGFLLFSFTDSVGIPYEAPIEWSNIRAFWERAKNRLNYNVRSTLFRGEAYQMQVFVESPYDFTPDQKDEIRNQYFQARIAMRKALLKYGDIDGQADSPTAPGDE
ncbi:MAG: exosortase U, partial [Pirellulaceae bacterium]